MIRRLVAVALLALTGCPSPNTAPPPQPAPQYPQQPYAYPAQQPPAYYPPQQPPPQQPPPAQPLPQQPPPQQPPPAQPPPQVQRPLLPPLIGSAAMQQEVRTVLAELVQNLGAGQKARVQGIPLVFDPALEVNAFAGCEKGSPFLAGTEGFLLAADAIAQTKATDEMFGTQTYDAYCKVVIPQILRSEKASPGLPAGIIPQNLGGDPRRWSRARELFQDIVAFTFGHELAHHYLNHTGCANGQPPGPNPAVIGNLLNTLIPVTNQPNEAAADSAGGLNALDTGAVRMPAYRYSERGGLLLLEFFARLEQAMGVNPLSPVVFLQSHPNPQLRIPILRDVIAAGWYRSHPQIQR